MNAHKVTVKTVYGDTEAFLQYDKVVIMEVVIIHYFI